MDRKNTTDPEGNGKVPEGGASKADTAKAGDCRKNGGWQAIEALREKAELKESLADVWDEDFALDEEILAELDHTAEFFTPQKENDEEIPGEGEDSGEYFDDDEV